jgi:hypothetical protein
MELPLPYETGKKQSAKNKRDRRGILHLVLTLELWYTSSVLQIL